MRHLGQIDSSLPPEFHRNGTWHLDYVFPVINGRKRTIVSLLDQATRYVILEEVSHRSAIQLEKALEKVFSYVGSPDKIVSDREKSVLSGEPPQKSMCTSACCICG